jgi:phage-related protein
VIELHVTTPEGLTPAQKASYKRTYSKYLNPLLGTKKLIFLDDPDVMYKVKYGGQIPVDNYANWLDFTIPLKMSDPFIYSKDQHVSTISGSSKIYNAGTIDTPVIIEVNGPATSPTISIGNSVLVFGGDLSGGDLLTIDTDDRKEEYDKRVVPFYRRFPDIGCGIICIGHTISFMRLQVV